MSDNALSEASARLVPQGSRVLERGCGNGELLAYLMTHRGCNG